MARAEVLRILNRPDEAAECYALALETGASEPVMALLQERLGEPAGTSSGRP